MRSLLLPLSVIAAIAVLLVPLPAAGLDYLLSFNLALSVLMLATVLFIKSPLEFSVFPTVLLASTLFRLILNVATTRLILTNAPRDGALAAGHVINTFSGFVTGNSLVVGVVIFSILLLVQFIVITKGTTRISEVAARFTLDSMPGKQAAIDADLNAGLIDQQQAQHRRQQITSQADFFGAMDGAAKFVRGDAVLSMCITSVNIVGGMIVGLSSGMSLTDVLDIFTRLTIGDGLVSQLPALLVSFSAGLIMTRSSESSDLPEQISRQIFSQPLALLVTGIFLILLIGTSLPKLPLLFLGGGCFGLGIALTRKEGRNRQEEANNQKRLEESQKLEKANQIEEYLTVEAIELELGPQIAEYLAYSEVRASQSVDPDSRTTSTSPSSLDPQFSQISRNSQFSQRLGILDQAGITRLAEQSPVLLAEQLKTLRQNVALQWGIVLPKVSVRTSNDDLTENGYRVRLYGTPTATGVVYPQMLFAVDLGDAYGQLTGLSAREPLTNNPGWWIAPQEQENAASQGYILRNWLEVIVSHLKELIGLHAGELLTRDATRSLLDQLHKTAPVVIDELIPDVLKLAQVQQILQRLLTQRVPIRQLGLILESLGEQPELNLIQLTEHVRTRLGRTICSPLADMDDKILAITLSSPLQTMVRDTCRISGTQIEIGLPPLTINFICQKLGRELDNMRLLRRKPVLLVSSEIRPLIQEILQVHFPALAILSAREIPPQILVESGGEIAED